MKFFLLSLVGFLSTIFLNVNAQPTNDDFVNAITITHSSNNCSADGAYTTINGTADLNKGSCWENGPNYNVWFKFVATTSEVTLDLKVGGAEGSLRHPNMSLWEINGTTEIRCVRRIDATTDVQISTSGLTVSNTYYISVDNYVGSGYQGTFTLCIDDAATYDDFNGALTITHSANNCSADGAYTTINASDDLNAGSCWENGPNYNRWFKFVATTTNVTLDLKVGGSEGTMRHPNMALWESDGTTEIKCVRRVDATTDVQISSSALTMGNTYYVSVDNYVGLGYRGTFTLCIDNTVTYDDYNGAITLTHSANNCSADAAYTTLNATADLNAGSCWENGPNYNRWFKFVATTTNVTLDLKVGGSEGTMRHPNMALWESDGTTEIKCVRRVDATTDVQISSSALTMGNTYYVSVDNYVGLGYRGTFTLCIDNTVTYDDYNGAITLTHSANNCSADAAYTTLNATADLNAGSCWENGPNYNRWFKFVATTTNVTLDLKVGGSEGTMRHPNMALWESDGTTEIKCVRRIDATTDVQISTASLTIGNTYYVSVDNYVGLGYRGTFTLCIDNSVTYDDYNGAILLSDINNWCSANAAYTTINATADKNAGSCWENGPNYNRWFKFVATTQFITLDLKVGGAEGSMRHPNMALWESDGTTEVACVRRVDATTDVQIATSGLTMGNTYYISVDNYVGLGYRGTFTLCANDQPSYDYYEGAQEITDLNAWCSNNAEFTTINATPDKNAGSCWENGPNYNRWFKFTAISTTVDLDMKVAGAEGTLRHPNMALWDSDGVTELACVRRINATTDVSISYSSLTIGQTYYISCDNYVGLGYRGTFTLCVDNSDETFYSIGSGAWNDGNNWSYSSGGPAAGDYPQVGDVANIEDADIALSTALSVAEVNIYMVSAATSLTVDGVNLNVTGEFNFTNSGNNFDGSVSIINGGSISVLDDLTARRDGGANAFDLLVDDGSIDVNKSFTWDINGGTTANSTMTVNNASDITINEDFILDHSGGTKLLIQHNNTSTLTVLADIEFIASGDDLLEIEMNNSSQLNIGSAFVRGSPAYGILDCNGNSIVNYNSTTNLQTMAEEAGSGTGDVFSYQNVTINNSRITIPQVTLEGPVTIQGTLTLTDGVLETTSSNLLTLAAGALLSGGSAASYLDGPLKKVGNTDFTFQSGDGSIWAPVGITNLTGDAATEFTAQYFYSTPINPSALKSPDPNGDLFNISGSEYWDVANTGTVSDADLTLHWKDQSRSDIDDYADLQIAHYDGAEWENLGQTSTTMSDPGSITVTGVSAFSPFTFGSLSSSSNPLPVELVSFKSTVSSNSIDIIWTTASEVNNDYFELEKSSDGLSFYNIARINGMGTSDKIHEYSFKDLEVYQGVQYYRLKQVDYDGSFEYSKIISSIFDGSQSIKLYPNPLYGEELFSDNIPPHNESDLHLFISDMNGKVLEEPSYKTTQKGISIPFHFKKGIYLLIIRTPENTFRKRVIKL